jgi:hypothetical protein
MEGREFIIQSSVVIDTLDVFEKTRNAFSSNYDNICRVNARLKEVSAEVKNRMSAGARISPFGFCVTGSPGIGKSSVLTFLYHLVSDIKGRTFSPGHVYERVVNSDFWDGYDMWSTPFVHYSEVGNTSSDIAKRVGEPVVRELTSVLDSMSMSLNMSDVKDKGKHFMNAEAVFIDTNTEDMNITHTVNNAAAVRRRFLYIVPTVKEEFRKPGSNVIDPDAPDNGNFYDKWLFDAFVCIPITATTFSKVFLCSAQEGDDIYVLEKVVREIYGDHLSKGAREKRKKEQPPPFIYSGEEIHSESLPVSSGSAISFAEKIRRCFHQNKGKVWSSFSLSMMLIVTSLVIFNRGKTNFFKCCMLLISAVMFYFPPFMICKLLFILYLASLIVDEAESFTVVEGAKRAYDFKEKIDHYYSGMMSQVNQIKKQSFFSSPVKIFAMAGAFGSIFVLHKFFKTLYSLNSSTESYDSCSQQNKENLLSLEETYSCGASVARVKTKGNSAVWNTVLTAPSLHKGTLVSLNQRIWRNVRRASVIVNGKKLVTQVLGVKGSYALINKHTLCDFHESFTIMVNKTPGICEESGFQETTCTSGNIYKFDCDLVLLRLNGFCFSDITKHFPKDCAKYSKAVTYVHDTKTISHYKGIVHADDANIGRVALGECVAYKWEHHKRGMCGIPVVAQRDSGSCIVGIHSAGSTSEDCYAVCLIREDLQTAIDRMENSTESYCSGFSEGLLEYGNLPHPKSPVRYEDLGQIVYYGCVSIPNVRQKSKLVRSIFSEDLGKFFYDKMSYIPALRYGRPVMQPTGSGDRFISPYNIGLRKMSVSKKSLHPTIMRKSIEQVYKQLSDNLHDCSYILQPYSFEVAVNGDSKDAFLRRANMATAAGYGFGGVKSYFFERIESGNNVIDDPKDYVMERVINMIKIYESGCLCHPVFTAQLKDEPRTLDKVKAGKTRLFFSTPLDFLIIQRMFLGPIYTLMVEKCSSFYTSIGIDMHRESHLIYEKLERFSPHILEGDYSGYDQSMPTEIGRGVCEIFLRLLKKFGYNDKQLKISEGILMDLMFPRVCILGEMMMIPSLQPSGKYATAEDNSLRNLLIMVYCWNTFPESLGNSFFDNVLPIVYGDDVIASVKEECDWFNNISFSSAVGKNTNMTFTTSAKNDDFVKYLTLDSMTFLKRSFVYHDQLQRVVGALDMSSLYKTLEWRIPSSNLNDMEQYEMTCNSVLIECYLHNHGNYFDDFKEFMLEHLFKVYNGVSFKLYTKEAVYNLLTIHPCKKEVSGGGLPDQINDTASQDSDADSADLAFTESDKELTFGRVDSLNQWPPNKFYIEELISRAESELRELRTKISSLNHPAPGISYRQVKQMKLYHTDKLFQKKCDEYFDLDQKIRSRIKSIDKWWEWIKRTGDDFKTESDTIEMNEGLISEENKVSHENVVDVSGKETAHTLYEPVITANVGQNNCLSVNKFFDRPLIVSQFNIGVDTDYLGSFDIWNLYLSNPSVRAKLRNYAYIRGEMNIRVALSGTPFHYGKVMLSYQPFYNWNKTISYYNISTPTGDLKEMYMTYLSQSKECLVLDVKDNQPVEMKFPFISPQPVLRLFNNSSLTITDATPFEDAVGFGSIVMSSIGPIRSATTPSTPIAVTIYAWMTDVQLGAPTGTVLEVTTESDERNTGPKEIISTAQAAWKGMMNVPRIKKYAKASGKVLEGMTALSPLFGFSEPLMDNEPMRVNPQPYQNGCTTIGYNTGKRLGYDPKEELTIDPSVAGGNSDEMAIHYMTSKESYLTTFRWSSDDAALLSPIWKAPVIPTLCKSVPTFSSVTYQPTSLGYAATPFEYWRGDIEFRFEIVCSAYHRGKLAFIYEPNVAQSSLIDTDLDLNKQYVKILDLQESQEMSLCIGWASPKPWMRVPQAQETGTLGDSSSVGPNMFPFANGYIAVVPFNELQSPQGGEITVNVYIKSDDIMFNVMTGNFYQQKVPSTESLTTHDSSCVNLNESSADVDGITQLHFGQCPMSFRTLLKRYASYLTESQRQVESFSNTAGVLRVTHEMYPPHWPDPQVTRPENLFGYLRGAYVGLRGSMRYRLNYVRGVNFSESDLIQVTLRSPQTGPVPYFAAANGSMSTINQSVTGTVVYVPHMNSGVDYEIPYYTNNAFGLSFVAGDDHYPSTCSLFEHRAIRAVSSAATFSDTSTSAYIVLSFSTGEDFSFLRFQGAPPFSIDA